MKNRLSIIMLLLLLGFQGVAQRSYAGHSVLSAGNWVKLGVTAEGMYKIDATTLAGWGLASGAINSAAIKLYGNGGAMLAEANAAPRIDDLAENAIEVVEHTKYQITQAGIDLYNQIRALPVALRGSTP